MPYPICEYSENSKRSNVALKLPILDQLEILNGWNEFNVIAVDGQNGTTKSSFVRHLRRTNKKVNDVLPDITCGSNYNFDPLRSIEYLFAQLSIKSHDSAWDRCHFSNLIFYYVHYLMFEFKNAAIPHDASIVWPILNKMAIDTNLVDVVDFCQRIKKVPTIFFVCRDVDWIGQSLMKRGMSTNNLNDIWNSKEYNYQMAQYHAYSWFGKLIGSPVFDISDFLENNYTIGDMHTMIAAKIDKNVDNLDFSLPDRTPSKELAKLLVPYENDVLIYDYSKK